MANSIQVPVVQTGLGQSINNAVRQIGPINVPVNINPAGFQNLAQPLGKITGLATEFEKSIAASNARVLAFGASVGIINGVQNALSDLVKSGIEVQKTLTEIGAISGQSGDQLRKFGNDIFDAAKNTGNSFKIASEAALEFSRQGLSAEETIKRTNDALTLARFTNLSAAESVDTLTAALNTFKETGITSSEIINKLVAVDTKFAVSAEDLAKGISRAGSIAQEVGVNFDQLNAAITVAQEKTARGGSVIGNALKTIFTNIRSDKAIEALRAIGVESVNAQGQLKGAIPLLQELSEKMKVMSGGERIQLLETVASKYNINILSSLLDDLNDANSKFGQAVKVSAGAGNEAYERLATLNKTLAADINRATESLTQFYAKLSEIGVTEGLSNMLKFVNNLLDGLNKLLDSEGVGGNIARGLIKGLSDIFFSVGLPIIAAIFVKLTSDIAKFGVESLKTILGINQQVRERAALEQAVVNTLIKDQQIMANILAMGNDRARQEQYLLSIYEAQINALQTVKNIGGAVAPGLMGAGLSAMSGTVTRRSAGGYLPAQEAADVRRGVGGANPSASVVAIPNFAFGNGKFGTMIANSSEYVVPNFANGGSAIFNQDMVKAYGLPTGAQKIAASGYIPNFAATEKAEFVSQYAGIVPSRVAGPARLSGRAKDGKIYEFPMVYAGSKTESGGNIDEIRNMVIKTSKDLASKNARDYALAFNPSLSINSKAVEEKATQANQNKGAIESFVGSIFEASIAALLDDTHFEAGKPSNFEESQSRSSISTFDFAVKPELKKIFEIPNGVQFLEAKNNAEKSNLNKIADKISRVEAGKAAFSTGNVYFDDPSRSNGKTRGRTFTDVSGANWIEDSLNNFRRATSQDDLSRYQKRGGAPTGATFRGASGYIPNFANPLGDAIHREMAAGLSPAQISITQDGRLRNAGNPSGLAVINSRDEPNGRIPNFAIQTRAPAGAVNAAGQNIGGQFVSSGSSYQSPIGPMPQGPAQNDPFLTTNKLMLAFGGLTMVTSQLQSNFKDTESGLAKFTTGLSQALTSASGYGMMGSMLGQSSIAGRIFGAGASALGPAGAGVGLLLGGMQAYVDMQEQEDQRRKDLQNTRIRAELERTAAYEGSAKEKYDKYKSETLGKAQENLAYEQENLRKIDRTPGLNSNETIEQQEKKVEDAKNRIKAIEAVLVELQKQATKELRDQIRQEEASYKATKERAVLSKEINDISLAFNRSQRQRELERAEALASEIAFSTNLTEDEKFRFDLRQKDIETRNKIDDIEQESVKRALEILAEKSATATVDKQELENLKEKLKATKDIAGVMITLKLLQTEGAIAAKTELDRLVANTVNEKEKVANQNDSAKAVAIGTKNAKDQFELFKLINDELDSMINSQRELQSIERDRQEKQTEFLIKTKTLSLERQISRQPFATAEQAYQLSKGRDEARMLSETANIEKQRRKAQEDADFAYKKDTMGQIGKLGFIGPEERNKIRQEISNLTTPEEIQKYIAQNISAYMPATGNAEEDAKNQQQFNSLIRENSTILAKNASLKENAATEAQRELEAVDKLYSKETALNELRMRSKTSAGVFRAMEDLSIEANNFQETFAYNTTHAFRDGLRDAMGAAISDSANLGQALQGIAQNFLKTMQSAFLQNASNNIMTAIMPQMGLKFATGGLVSGGSGYMDDVPAMLTGGEFVMSKSAVQKYGAGNLARMNSGGMFLPGVRGGGDITGIDALRAFATQTTTSGATDILRGTGSSAYLSLEDQSAKLSRWALLNNDVIGGEIRSAQEQGLSAISQYDANRTQQRKAMQQAIVGTLASAALSAGIGALTKPSPTSSYGIKSGGVGLASYGSSANTVGGPMSFGSFADSMTRIPYKAYGGPTDDTPAMLMSGEFVMSRGAARKYGTSFLNSMNSGRAPRFADGGAVDVSVADSSPSNKKATMNGDINISINVASNGSSDTKMQGGEQSTAGGIDYKKMSERIKAVVLETIQEEKRLGGALRR